MAIILDPTAPPPENGGPSADRAQDDLIKETDTAQFVSDVLEESMTVPVIVDFWAPWCGPCKQLGPMLEKLVRRAGGLVKLVKVNVDENRELAMQMNIQSIPAVFGFQNGQPVDGFSGVLSESQIDGFIDRLTGGAKSPVERILDDAKAALEAGDAAEASGLYAGVLAQDSANPAAVAGMIRCFLATKDFARAREAIAQLPQPIKTHSDVAAAISAVDLADQGSTPGDLVALQARLARDDDDHDARFDLATALYGSGDSAGAIDALIELVRRDRHWNDEAARKQLVKIFEALGPADPETVEGRRQLSSILFS